MARKKRKPRQQQKTVGAEDRQETENELVALQAIFPDIELDSDDKGVQLVVAPHQGDDDTYVSVTLHIRYPEAYPKQPLQLRLLAVKGLLVKQSRQLSKLLHQQAEEYASREEVATYSIVDQCQEFLHEHNRPNSDAGRPDTSLWHDMLQRAGSEEVPELQQTPLATARWTDTDEGGLFASVEDDPADWQQGAAPQQETAAWANLPQEQKADETKLQKPPAGALPTGTTTHLVSRALPPEASASMMDGMISAMRSSITAFGKNMSGLPSFMRRLLASSGSASPAEGGEGDEAGAEDRAQHRNDVLLGHLLALATGRGGLATATLPAHALPALAAHLDAQKLLPGWVHWALIQHPEVFNRAFQQLFSDVRDSALPNPGTDPASSWLLEQFWKRGVDTTSGALPPGPATVTPLSRYHSDFQELQILGKGGYGVVVAAINRLDGRKYAVKRIPLNAQTPASYARIMREVSTLSRLQHPHVVRYFQAWCEDAFGDLQPSTPSDDTQLDDWLATTETSQLTGQHTTPLADSDVLFQDSEHQSAAAGAEGDQSDAGARSPLLSSSAQVDAVDKSATETSSEQGLGFFRPGSEVTATTATEESGAEHADNDLPGTGEPGPAAAGSTVTSKPSTLKLSQLFIQMEFCPRTLQKALQLGPIDEQHAWQVVRQLLAGLAYIHAQGIIHRDLKPANIFYDARGDVKLGDFGLAKFNLSNAAEGRLSLDAGLSDVPAGTFGRQPFPVHRSMPSEATGAVGTSYYISPEIVHGRLPHDEKVDLFSLGVITFELWHPFSTGMERHVCLTELQRQGTLPANFEANNPAVAKLIHQMMMPDPCSRPSAREVLRSELVPPAVGDEQLIDLLRSLPDSRDKYDRVVDAIFNMPDVGLPGESMPGTPAETQMDAQKAVEEAIVGVFSLHGAVPMASNTVGACPADPPRNAAVLLTSDGARLALRYDLRTPFAAWLSRRAAAAAVPGGITLEAMRRYEVAWVRRKAVGRSVPRSHLQADLDLVSGGGQAPAEALLAEAEALKAVTEILERLPEAGGIEIRLSHRHILDAALALIGIPKELQERALLQLNRALVASASPGGQRASLWPSIRVALEGLKMDSNAVQLCKQFLLQVPGEAEAALHRLQAKLATTRTPLPRQAALAAAMEAMALLLQHLGAWGVPASRVMLEPLMRPHADYYAGTIFQVHLVHGDTSACALVAVGGRYDALLKAIWPKAAAPMGAVGVTVAADGLVARLAAAHTRTEADYLPASQADVLVCARGGGGLLRDRMALVAQLWAGGIKAEMMHAASPSVTEQFEYANTRRFAVLVTLHGATFSATGTVKVKHLDRRGGDEDVPCADLVRHLQSILGLVPAMLKSAPAKAASEALDADNSPEEGQRRRKK